MRFNEMLEGIRADIAVKIFGNDSMFWNGSVRK
jgi:Cu/Ag efflux pump CusA